MVFKGSILFRSLWNKKGILKKFPLLPKSFKNWRKIETKKKWVKKLKKGGRINPLVFLKEFGRKKSEGKGRKNFQSKPILLSLLLLFKVSQSFLEAKEVVK